MFREKRRYCIFSFVIFLAIGILLPLTSFAQDGKLEWSQITSPSLEGNLIGDSAKRSFAIYLPPSYETSEKRYPVIYLLPGYGGSPAGYTNIKPTIDSMIKNGNIGEMMVVFVDGSNRFGGSFYRSSETIGDYEGYITKDLVNHIDSNYRTIAHRDSRGITGHSMGGYGCMHLALIYPNVFSAVVAQGGLYKNDSDYIRNLEMATAADTKDWGEFNQLFWMTQAAYALTAALAPNPNNPPFYLDKAFKMVDGKAQVVPEVWDSFIKNDIVDSELSRYLEQPVRLNGIMFAHGSSDGIVPVSQAQALDKAMTELGIEHVYDEHGGGHEFTASKSLQFLSDHLSFSPPKQVSDITFTDVTAEAGVGNKEIAAGLAVGDYDRDGFLDIYLCNGGLSAKQTSILYHNNGNGTFSDVTQKSGVLREPDTSLAAAFFDYDNDGWCELYVTNFGEWAPASDSFFHSNGDGTFESLDVVKVTGIQPEVYSSIPTVFDYNNDGLLDIYASYGTFHSNKLLRNNGDGTFTNVAQESKVANLDDNVSSAMGDYDNDGDMDLYVTEWAWGRNVLYINDGQGVFKNVPMPSVTSNVANCLDYDNDGDFDIFVSARQGRHMLYRNRGDATFDDVAEEAGIKRWVSNMCGATFGDYDNDGHIDFFMAGWGGNFGGWTMPRFESKIYHNNGDGTFTDVTDELGLKYVDTGLSGFLDFDNDGHLDLYVTRRQDSNILLRNEGNENHWIHINTIGVKSNRDGIGAKVKVVAGELSMLRMIEADARGQGLRVHFGLGKNPKVELIRIEWPSGQVDELRDVDADQFITVEEGVGIISDVTTSVQPQSKSFITWGKAKQDRLMQNYPNPFNPETWIPYQLGKATDVVIEIHTASGQLVRSLNFGHKSAGSYINRDKAAYWDGKNESGELVSSGTYFYTIEAGDFTATRKMVIAK